MYRNHSISYALVCEKTFLAHDCIPLKTKVELLSVRKKFYVEF